MWRSEGNFAEKFSPSPWSQLVTTVVPTPDSPSASFQLTLPCLPPISLHICWDCRCASSNKAFDLGSRGQTQVTRCAQKVLLPVSLSVALNSNLFKMWLYFHSVLDHLVLPCLMIFRCDDLFRQSALICSHSPAHLAVFLGPFLMGPTTPVCPSCWLTAHLLISKPCSLRTRTMSY